MPRSAANKTNSRPPKSNNTTNVNSSNQRPRLSADPFDSQLQTSRIFTGLKEIKFSHLSNKYFSCQMNLN